MTEEKKNSLHPGIRLWGLFSAAGAVACAATLLGFLGRFSWFLDLFSHFRVQYVIGLTILGIISLAWKHRCAAAAFMVFACVNAVPVLPLYFGGQGDPPGDAPVLRAMLINVNTRMGDPQRVREIIQKADPDILVLEEISQEWVRSLQWLTNSLPHSAVRPRDDNFGIGLYSRLPLAEKRIVSIGDAEVPSILATVETGTNLLRVIATHPLPPGGAEYSKWRNGQLEKLPEYIDASRPLILLGDLNVTHWNYHFKKLLRRSGLRDSSRGRGFQPTWPSFSLLFRIPIDHCLHSPGIVVHRKEVGPDVNSDHFPVIIEFSLKNGQKWQKTTKNGQKVPKYAQKRLKKAKNREKRPKMTEN